MEFFVTHMLNYYPCHRCFMKLRFTCLRTLNYYSFSLKIDQLKTLRMVWLLGIITIVLLASPVFSFSPSERKQIQELYAGDDNYDKMLHELIRLGHLVSTQHADPCMVLYSAGFFPEFNLTDMKTTVSVGRVSASLEDSLHFDMAGFIICIPMINKTALPETYLMVINVRTSETDRNYRFAYWRVVEDGYYDGKKAFTTNEVLGIRRLTITYTQNLEKAVPLFVERHNELGPELLCDVITTRIQDKSEVCGGEIKLKTFDLQLDENQHVEIPGVVICLIKKTSGNYDLLYYVMSFDKEVKWYQVYTDSNRQKFYFEKYLIQ